MNTKRTERHEVLYGELSKDPSAIETLVLAGQQIGEPAPIFREISNEEMEKWKSQFS
jgi:hypothetical protein